MRCTYAGMCKSNEKNVVRPALVLLGADFRATPVESIASLPSSLGPGAPEIRIKACEIRCGSQNPTDAVCLLRKNKKPARPYWQKTFTVQC